MISIASEFGIDASMLVKEADKYCLGAYLRGFELM